MRKLILYRDAIDKCALRFNFRVRSNRKNAVFLVEKQRDGVLFDSLEGLGITIPISLRVKLIRHILVYFSASEAHITRSKLESDPTYLYVYVFK